VTGCCVATTSLETSSGWWELSQAKGGNLSCIVGASTEFLSSDIVGMREEAMFNRSRNWLNPDACATLDVKKHELRGLSVKSRFLASIALSANNEGGRPGCALNVCRMPSSHLQTLVLSGVMVGYASQSVEVIAQTQTLRCVALRDCRMVSSWYELAHLRLLETLDLSGCGLDLDLRVLSTCTSLRKLLIARNRPHGFHALTQVTTLDCSDCALETFSALVACTSITTLNASGNQPLSTEALVICLVAMPKLKRLAVENCGRIALPILCQALRDAVTHEPGQPLYNRQRNEVVSAHQAPPALEYLSFGMHEVDGLDDPHASIGALRSLKHVVVYGKHSNVQTLKFVRQLWSAPLLTRLTVRDADLAESGLLPPSIWAAVGNLKVLELTSCRIRSLAGIEHCVGAPLEELSLNGNYLSGDDKDPSLVSLLPILERGLKQLHLVNAALEDFDWLRTSSRFASSVRYPELQVLDIQDNGHFSSGGDFISAFFPNLKTLGLAPSYQFDLNRIAQNCKSLEQLHGIHPITSLGNITPFQRVVTVSLYENSLLHGVSLTFQFLRKLPEMFPNVTTFGLKVHHVVDGHVEILSTLPLLRSLAMFPSQKVQLENLALWKRLPSLAQVVVVIPRKQDQEAKDALYNELLGQPIHVDGISSLEVDVSRWVSRMPPNLFPIEVVDVCPWW
jgi:Leucine-rich repeat (LRR) protein